MLKIKLQRIGRKNDPHFRIVVIDNKKGPKSGSFIERLGFYNPKSGEKKFEKERIKYWLSVGAKPSETIHNMLIDEKLIAGNKIHVSRQKPKKEKTPAAT